MLAHEGNQQVKSKRVVLQAVRLPAGEIARNADNTDFDRRRYLGNAAVQSMGGENAPATPAKQQRKRPASNSPQHSSRLPVDETEADFNAMGLSLILAKDQRPGQRVRSTAYFHKRFLVQNDVEWYFNIDPWSSVYGRFDLVIDMDPQARRLLSAPLIGAASVAALARDTGLTFKDGGKGMVEYIAGQIDARGLHGSTFYIPFEYETLLNYFDQRSFVAFFEGKRQDFRSGVADVQLIAAGNFKSATRSKHGRPRWTRVKQRQVEALTDKARRKKPRPLDLPDELVVWYNSRNQSWYVNVWVNLDTQGRKRVSYPVRLRPEESAEALFERVCAAVPKALQRAEDERKKERAQALPAWARRIERRVRRGLREQRRKNKEATDFPDGLALVAEPWRSRSPEAGRAADKPGADIYLQVWVERGEAPHTRRNAARIPFALTPQTNVPHLIAYVRHQAAILRQFEHTPLGEQPPAPDAVKITAPGTEQALNAFPAEILAKDLRPDQVTVTGAKNEFGMQLDYEAVYGGGELRDLYIASKLFRQYIHFFWKIYKVPPDLKPAEGERRVPTDWPRRWQWLNETFNARNRDDPDAAWNNISRLGDPVYETNGSDPVTRVKFPSESDEAGDYLVFCQTGHAPIGEHDLERVSSVAYYPVRVRPIEKEARSAVSRRTEAAAALRAELKAIDAMLAQGGLEASQEEMFEAVRRIKRADLQRLEDREKQTFAESTAKEIRHARAVLERLGRLEKILPHVRRVAKEQGLAPSGQLAQTPELQDLYWYLIGESKTLPGYKKELQAQIKQLQAYAGRADEFKNEFKAGSDYQYSPEAAFVSTLTGSVYPLVLLLGEAPDTIRNMMSVGKGGGVAYSVVDITSAQTQKVHYGYSPLSGPQGHRQAIDNAFENFGKDATYGEGKIAVRIPPGRVGADDRNHPGTGMKTYDSDQGFIQKALWALGVIAAVAGMAALAATGIGAPVAAAWIGAFAAVAGAVTAAHNISERSSRHKLEWDAEMALDIISIVSVIPLTAGLRLARLPRTMANLRSVRVTEQFVRIYGWGETAATVVLVPTKLAQDIQRIENDKTLTPAQRAALIREAKLGAFQTGLMMIGAGAAAMGHRARSRMGFDPVDEAALNQQIELVELEGLGQYETMTQRGYLDESGQWTAKARAIAPPETETPGVRAPRPEEALPPAPRQPVRTALGTGGKTPGPPQPRRPGRPAGDYYVAKDSPEYHRLRHEAWSAEMVRSGLRPDRTAKAAKGGEPLRRGVFQSDIETPEAAFRIYEEALARANGREVAIYREADTGRYAVTVGTPFEVGPPWQGNWEGVLHYHQNPANVLTYRMPAPADVEGTVLTAFRNEGRLVTEFVEHPIPGGGRGRVAYSAIYENGRLRITIETIRADGRPVKLTYSSLEEYQTGYVRRKRYVDPQSEEYKWLRSDLGVPVDDTGAGATRTMAGSRKAKGAGEPPVKKTTAGIRPAGIDEDEPTQVFRRQPGERTTPAEGGPETGEPVRTKTAQEQPLPEATVLQLARPAKITAAHVRDVYQTYRKMVTDDPSREVGLYHNPVTRDFILVQGNENAVIVSTTGEQSPLRGGRTQKWKTILDAGEDVGRWELVRHFHPAPPGSEFVPDVSRLPSGAVKDMDVIYFESVRAGGQARTSTIDYMTPHGPEYTTFGFNPDHDRPFWVNYPDPRTRTRMTRRFADLEAYHDWMRQTFHVDPGPVPRGHVPGEAPPKAGPRSGSAPRVSASRTPGEPPRPPVRPLDRDQALGHHTEMDQGRRRTRDGRRILRVPAELYDAAWQRTGNPGPAPRFGFEDDVRGQIVIHSRRPDILDSAGRLQRGANDPQHYYAREFFDDTTALGLDEARYFAEAHLRSDGIVDLDFRLRIAGQGGMRRSQQLRGREEFNSALTHFRRNKLRVKGIRGDWNAGDNLQRFNERFIRHLGNNLSRDEAFRLAALETHTGGWAAAAGFINVRPEVQDFNSSTMRFEHVVVVFERGPGPRPGDESGRISRWIAEEIEGLARPGSAPLDPRSLRPGLELKYTPQARARAQMTIQEHLLPLARRETGGVIPLVAAEHVHFYDVAVARRGNELQVGYFGIHRRSAPGGAAREMQEALEKAAFQVARQIGANTARIFVQTVVNPAWRAFLTARGYTNFPRPHAQGVEIVMAKRFPIPERMTRIDHERPRLSPPPIPAQWPDIQRFGVAGVRWGAGEKGARTRLQALKKMSRGQALRELTAAGITLDIAEGWRFHYYYEYYVAGMPNKTAKVREELMAYIVELLSRRAARKLTP